MKMIRHENVTQNFGIVLVSHKVQTVTNQLKIRRAIKDMQPLIASCGHKKASLML
jgi:hypothetical protein